MIHMPSMRDRNRRTSLGQVSGGVAIHDAVVKGKIHLAKFILDAVESHSVVNSRDAHGKTPLIRAVRIEEDGVRSRVVDLLVKYHADVNLVDNVGRSALSYACELHRNDVIKSLVKNNVDPNLQDKNGNTPLMYCAMSDNATGIEILSKSFRRLGLDVDSVNADGMTPLMVAAKSGFAECAQLLAHEAKASVFQRDNVHNMNALDWAKEGGCSTPDVESLQPRSRAHSRSAVNLSNHENTQDDRSHHERLLSKREQVSPTTTDRGLTSSLPQIDSDFDKESRPKLVGSQPDIRNLHNDKRRFHQLSLGELSQKFHGLSPGSSLDNLVSRSNTPSPETPKRAVAAKRCTTRGSVGDSEHKLSNESLPDNLKVHAHDPHQASQMQRPSTSIGVFNKRVQQPGSNQRRRPLSANVTAGYNSRQSKSFDSALISGVSTSVENMALAVTQPHVTPHPPTAPREAGSLSRLSHLSRSTEVLSQRVPSFEQEDGNSRCSNSMVSYMDLHGVSTSSKWEAHLSPLTPGDLTGVLTNNESSPNNHQCDHLPPLSPSS